MQLSDKTNELIRLLNNTRVTDQVFPIPISSTPEEASKLWNEQQEKKLKYEEATTNCHNARHELSQQITTAILDQAFEAIEEEFAIVFNRSKQWDILLKVMENRNEDNRNSWENDFQTVLSYLRFYAEMQRAQNE